MEHIKTEYAPIAMQNPFSHDYATFFFYPFIFLYNSVW